jgi:DNA (cytosine-5)-methyltransferase 1
MTKLKFIDLFTGVGGFRYSFEQVCKNAHIKTKCIGFSEIDKYAKITYKNNFEVSNDEVDLGDITKVNPKKIPPFNFLFAGFPCQPFSLMGKKKGFADTRGTMFFYIEKIIKEKKPQFFLLENVRGLFTHDSGKTYAEIIKILEKKLKYHTISWVLDSKDYGVPQTRRRLYILGFLDRKLKSKIKKPEKISNPQYPTTWHLLDKKVDENYYLSDKILKIILADGSGNFKSKSEINPVIARPLTATMHKMHRACQDNYFSDSFINGRLNESKEEIILSKSGMNRIRKITPEEAFRLQGYPSYFVENAKKNGVSNTQLYRQAGNSITVNVVQSILNEVISNIN